MLGFGREGCSGNTHLDPSRFKERGINAPSFSTLEKLALVFEVKVFELFMFD